MNKHERAREMHAQGVNMAEIGRRLDVARGTAWGWVHSRSGRLIPRARRTNYSVTITIPPEVLEDRDRRASLARPNYTAEFFGDPLPGYSALDRRG